MEEAWELAAVSNKTHPTELTVSPDGGVGAKLDGEILDRLSREFHKLISVLPEGGAYLGAYVRGKRAELALKTLVRAKTICDENGIRQNPVSFRLLTNLTEEASLELENDEPLTEKYAFLLANAINDEKKIHLTFTDLLSKIGHQEVRLLDALFNRVNSYEYVSNLSKLDYYGDQLADEEIRVKWDQQIQNALAIRHRGDLPESYTVEGVLGRGWLESNYSTVLLLKSLGLVDLKSQLDDSEYLTVYLTPLGYEFITACSLVTK